METDLQFVTMQGCTQNQVHTNLRPDPQRAGIVPGWKPNSKLKWRPKDGNAALHDLLPLFRDYLNQCVKDNDAKPPDQKQRFFDGTCAKVTGWRTSAERDELAVDLIKTSYYTHICTNRLLARTPPMRNPSSEILNLIEQISRKLDALKGNNSLNDLLADVLSVHVMLIGPHEDATGMLITRRSGDAVSEAWGEWNSSAGGYVFPEKSTMLAAGDIPGYRFAKRRKEANVDLFLAARRELWEELAVYVPLCHMRLTALCSIKRHHHPHVVIEAFIADELESFKKRLDRAIETWEVEKHKIISLSIAGFKQLLKGDKKMPGLLSGVQGSGGGTWTSVGRIAVLLAFLRHVPGAWAELKAYASDRSKLTSGLISRGGTD